MRKKIKRKYYTIENHTKKYYSFGEADCELSSISDSSDGVTNYYLKLHVEYTSGAVYEGCIIFVRLCMIKTIRYEETYSAFPRKWTKFTSFYGAALKRV